MAHTYHQHLFHLVWSTKERQPLLHSAFKQRMFEFLGGAFRTAGCMCVQVGGMSDHIHALVAIPPKYAVSEIIRDVKVCSSKWITTGATDCKAFAWQEGYGSFTVSVSQKEAVIRYIVTQEEHHKTQTFEDEFKTFLKVHEVSYDEKYLWR
jgi:putative transposase